MPRRKTPPKSPAKPAASDTVDRLRKALDITEEALRQLGSGKTKKKGPRPKSH